MGVVLSLSHLPNPPPTSMGHLLMIIHLCQESLCSLGNYMRCSSMPKRETLLTLLAGCPEPHASRSTTTKLLSKPLCHDFLNRLNTRASNANSICMALAEEAQGQPRVRTIILVSSKEGKSSLL